MVRTEKYVPKTNLFGLDVPLFERYFGYKAVGLQEPGAGVPSPPALRWICVEIPLANALCTSLPDHHCMLCDLMLLLGERSDDAEVITAEDSSATVASTELPSLIPGKIIEICDEWLVLLAHDACMLVSNSVMLQRISQLWRAKKHLVNLLANRCALVSTGRMFSSWWNFPCSASPTLLTRWALYYSSN
jgi:hypothetical protein